MKFIIIGLGTLATLGGMFCLGYAILTPTLYTTENVLQQSTVMAIGTYRAVLAIALFAFAAVCILSQRPLNDPEQDEYQEWLKTMRAKAQ